MKKVFLHIGTPKTGTSIIQSHLAQNRGALRDLGYLYPITISADEKLYRTYESHHLLTYSIADWEPFNRYSPENFFQMAESTAAENDIETLLLSAENTYWLPRQIVGRDLPEEAVFWEEKRSYVRNIREYLKSYETKIVIYLRRQDRWLESWFNQQVKNGNALIENMDQFVEHHRWLVDYEKTLSIWADEFGTENMIVRVYEKEQLPNGLFEDYCEQVGIADPDLLPLQKPARYNAQLNRDALEFMNICNSLSMDFQQRWWLRMKVRKITKQFESQLVFHNQSLLSPDQRIRLVSSYADMNSTIAKTYLGRPDGVLFKEAPPVADENWQPYTGLSSQKVLEIVMQLLLEIQAEQAANGHASATGQEKSKLVTDDEQQSADRAYWAENIWHHQ